MRWPAAALHPKTKRRRAVPQPERRAFKVHQLRRCRSSALPHRTQVQGRRLRRFRGRPRWQAPTHALTAPGRRATETRRTTWGPRSTEWRPTTSRPSRRCWAPSSSTMRRTTASRVPGAADFFDPLHQQIYETAAKLIAGGAGDADHAQDLLRERRADRRHPHRAAVPRPARRQRRHYHQRARLRPHHPRSRHPPGADHDRRGCGEHSLRRARRLPAPGADRGGRGAPLRSMEREATSAKRRRMVPWISDRGRRRGVSSGAAGSPAFRLGIRALMRRLGGLGAGDLIVLAGTPSMGKTALALNIASQRCRAGNADARCSRWKCRPASWRCGSSRDGSSVPGSEMQRGRMADPDATMRGAASEPAKHEGSGRSTSTNPAG